MANFLYLGSRTIFWLLCLLIAAVSLRFLFLPLALVMDHMAHYLAPVPIALYAHIIGAPLALALAPFQLWQGLRSKRRAVHKAMGRAYVLAVVVSGLGSLALLPHFLGSTFAAAGFAALALVWIGVTLRGVVLARAGNLAAHRHMMLRSVALTAAAITLRLIMAPLVAQGWSVVETYQITAWGCWLPNLIAVEIYLRHQSKRPPQGSLLNRFIWSGRRDSNSRP